jgi:myo-inositol 2-dehydrogenase / D-chiro-inositol 1-dehydrogenase
MAARELGIQVTAVASRTKARAEKLAAELGARAVTYDQLPGIAELVVVATPPSQHVEHAAAHLAAGSAVLLEKPLCTTLDDADRLVSLAPSGQLMYAENLAYAPVVWEMLRQVTELGSLDYLEVRALQGLPQWGDSTTTGWGGGALFDLGAHPLALAMLLGRPATVTKVSATLRAGTSNDTDEYGEVELTFSTGLKARVVASWQAGPGPIWDAQASSSRGVVRAEIMPEPSLERNGTAIHLPKITSVVASMEQFGYVGQLRALLAATKSGTSPVMSMHFGREVLEVTSAAYFSARHDGRAVWAPFNGTRLLTPHELWTTDSG